jgi:hypothetical protein
MKITDIINEHELQEGPLLNKIGSTAKAVGSGIKNFAQGFAKGVKGEPKSTAAGSPLDDIKVAIGKLNPTQQAALRKQIAQRAGVA